MVLTAVTSHTTDFPLSHGIIDMPSGLLLSILDKLVGSFITGIPALVIDSHIMSFRVWWREKRSVHLATKTKVAININHSAALTGWHRGTPRCSLTAILIALLSWHKPHVLISRILLLLLLLFFYLVELCIFWPFGILHSQPHWRWMTV